MFPIFLGIALYALLVSLLVHLFAWGIWCAHGKPILFITSDSPIWRDYIGENILPRLEGRSTVLNWSERKKWKIAPAAVVFKHMSGAADFNPMAVVFRPFKPTRFFRFYRPFHDFKHGNPQPLNDLEREFFEMVDGL